MPILDARSLEFFSRSPEQTRRVGMRLGAMLQCGDLVCLSGDLGSGKTTLVQGLARGWGSTDAVSSPTFILVNAYRRPDGQVLHHLDAYRIATAHEALDLDMDALLEKGALVIEWPERISAALPPERLWVNLRWLSDEQRGMVFSAKGERSEGLLGDIRHRLYGGV